jgi:hypothetical protein
MKDSTRRVKDYVESKYTSNTIFKDTDQDFVEMERNQKQRRRNRVGTILANVISVQNLSR